MPAHRAKTSERAARAGGPVNYIHELGPLFEAVQLGRIFADSKTFPDCEPKAALATIAARYRSEAAAPGFDLRNFVGRHFDAPAAAALQFASDPARTAAEHIDALWPALTRAPDVPRGNSLIALARPYVVPGGRFREVYYWDSYFTMLGLQQAGRSTLMHDMVANFAALIDTLGYVPNGNRGYYLGRSQPPFFALMVGLLAAQDGAAVWARYLPQLQREYQFWMDGDSPQLAPRTACGHVVCMSDGSRLNRYWDIQATPRPEAYREDVELARRSALAPAQTWRHLRAAAESGWDFSSRWLADPADLSTIHTTDIVPVDLNCLLWQLERQLADAHRAGGDSVQAAAFDAAAERRAQAIQTWFFNDAEDFYFDWDLRAGKPSQQATLAAVYPLFFGLASGTAAAAVARRLEDQFLQPGGLVTTLHRSGQQWDAPNGWAPLQWMAHAGLRRYAAQRLAGELRRRWLATCERVYRATGKMMEKYDVSDAGRPGGGGEYPNQDGFGWTNGVYLALLAQDEQSSG